MADGTRVRFTPGGIRKGAPATTSASSTRRATRRPPLCGEGVLIELVQAPPDIVAALGR